MPTRREKLARYIEHALKSQQSSLIVADILGVCWPLPREAQIAEIEIFAAGHGWRVEISEWREMGLVAEFFLGIEMRPSFSTERFGGAGAPSIARAVEALLAECQRLRAEADRLESQASLLQVGARRHFPEASVVESQPESSA